MVQKANSKKELSIFGYTNFRDYLRDFYELRKAGARGYSFRTFSLQAGFSSPNILKLVIDNKRNISSKAIANFNKALGLEGSAAEYFEALVEMNQSTSDERKEFYFHKLHRLMPFNKKRELGSEAVQYLSHWIYPVIREMTALDDFSDDPYWLQRRLYDDVSPKEINAALNFLFKEALIKRDEGRFIPQDNMVISSDEVKSLAIRNYHRQMLQQAAKALESTPMEEREFGALTIILPKEHLSELKLKLKEFRKSLHQWAVEKTQEGKREAVVQVNFQMYPHSKDTES